MEEISPHQEELERLAGTANDDGQHQHKEGESTPDRFETDRLVRLLQQDGGRDRRWGRREVIERIEQFRRRRDDHGDRVVLDELLTVLRKDLWE